DLSGVFSLATPDNAGPARLDAIAYTPSPGEVARARQGPLNGMQAALTRLAAHLPDPSGAASPAAAIDAHIQALSAAPAVAAAGDKVLTPPQALATRADALHFIKQRMQALFSAF